MWDFTKFVTLPYKAGGVLLLAIGLLLAGYFWGEKSGKNATKEDVTPAPAQSLPSGAVLAERASPTDEPPAKEIPKWMTEVRRAKIVVQPRAAKSGMNCSCDPVTVDTSLLLDGKGGQRLEVSSPDGTIISAKDTPIRSMLVPDDVKRWAAGIGYGSNRAKAAYITRDLDRLRIGAEVIKAPGLPVFGMVTIGVTF